MLTAKQIYGGHLVSISHKGEKIAEFFLKPAEKLSEWDVEIQYVRKNCSYKYFMQSINALDHWFYNIHSAHLNRNAEYFGEFQEETP
jgi:hypothetical protein